MSLDNIELPATIVQSLYGKSLYNLKTNKSSLDTVHAASIGFLGGNQKKTALMVNAAGAIYLPDDELSFLLGILTACKLGMADIALINVSKNPGLLYTDITEQLKAEKIFLFGLDSEALALPLQFPRYQVQKYNNQVYLSSASLTELQNDKNEKLKLWNCLKKVFAL